MNLSLTEEQQLIVDSAVTFLATASAMPAVRATSESADGFDAALWQGIAELGWCGVNLPEAQGGLGLGLVELVLLQEQLGRHLACVPFFDSVALAVTCLRELSDASELAAHWLPQLACGATIGALALAAPGQTLPLATPFDGGWRVDGLWPQVGSGAQAGLLLLPAQTAAGEALLFAVEAGSPGLHVQALATIDATRRSAVLRAEGLVIKATACVAQGQSLTLALQRTRCLAAIALAAEQVGVAERALGLTLGYTAGRHQFDRSIAGFQAVKHRCALMAVRLEGARSAVYGAACIADTDADTATLLFNAAQALVEACEAAQFCTQEAIQLHGGVGFTWEYDPHLYFRRSQVSVHRLGAPAWWTEQVAAQLLDAELDCKEAA
jgi:alkylation response protein AidB-like acyl-CoA dehydrogenase